MANGRRIVVIGSANMDIVCRTARFPRAGETIAGESVVTIPGGKGANQAVAAARLADAQTPVHLVGRVGDDEFGARLLNELSAHGVQIEHMVVTEGTASGCAIIVVDRKGENSIVVASGANGLVKPKDVDAAREIIGEAAVVVLQLEIPPATVLHAIALCQELGVYTILDPAPAPEDGLPAEFYGVDLLTPNRSEARSLAGGTAGADASVRRKLADPKTIAARLLASGATSVVLKQGSRGATVVDREGALERVAGFKVPVVDTTAAGDAFTGALAVAKVEGATLLEAVRFANAAGALACTVVGAQPSLPNRGAVQALMR